MVNGLIAYSSMVYALISATVFTIMEESKLHLSIYQSKLLKQEEWCERIKIDWTFINKKLSIKRETIHIFILNINSGIMVESRERTFIMIKPDGV
jgi:hypothetical protein